ncbi:glycoside hydrolase family 6 protein [Streptomyces sp. NPDC060194]|uniref:glycoside hydrolase family 6 protein n=1 Tax=Streptomyces sp. NPDC060194 TaxID=3347069 RepID=UPI003668551C
MTVRPTRSGRFEQRSAPSRLAALALAGLVVASAAVTGPAAASGHDGRPGQDDRPGHGGGNGGGPGGGHGPGHGGKRIYVNPESSTVEAAAKLKGQARKDALTLAAVPSATWFTKGTPAEVRASAADLVRRADRADAVPVLVAYNIPFRDCALYSQGGAADSAAYAAWIKGLAQGIGNREAIVVLEPDGLGVIPWYTDINGVPEKCRPADQDPETAADKRFAQLRNAVDQLKALPRTSVYLDGTGSNWLSPGDATQRLRKANVAKADGFFMNVSNYEADDRLAHYAHWLSDCLALADAGYPEASCRSQYYPATFDDTSTWTLTDAAYDAAFAEVGIARDPARQKKALLDTSRNGLGSWTPPAGKYADAEVWCNPPGRGAGARPSLATGDPYVAARLWVKIPGESDGKCYRGTGGPLDPERGMVDPDAGHWFPEQARELVSLAVPRLERGHGRD